MTKQAGYKIFAGVYGFCCIFWRVKAKKIVLWNGHNHGINGNLLEIRNAYQAKPEGYHLYTLVKRDLFHDRETGERKRAGALLWDLWKFFVIFPWHMATAEKVFLNDNFLPLSHMKTKGRKTQFIQLWHGVGAFKRFGLSVEKDPAVADCVKKANQRITHLFVSSRHVIPFYQEAFAVPEQRIYATGLPVTDIYFDAEKKEKRKECFFRQYPQLKGKKLLLYAPTFRRTNQENQNILKQFDVEKIHKILGEEWILLIRFHPKYPMENFGQNDYCYNMTCYNEITDLYLVSDMLVTDYSSSVVEYVLLDRPILLYAYDLEQYDRGFYFDYTACMPGEIARTQEELLELLQKSRKNIPKRQDFVKFQYDNNKGDACERILEQLR